MPVADPTALRWAEAAWGRPVTAAHRLAGGWTSTVLRLTAASGESAVLRLMTRDPWRRHAPELLAREADVQARLWRGAVPAPRSIAVDPSGGVAGTPAHLMSWLPGALELARADDHLVGRLADLLVTIHRLDPGPVRPRAFQSWAGPRKWVVPPWSSRPVLWERAFGELRQAAPGHTGVFLHRDFHLGNVLWSGGEVTGVVDWVETSWGPAWLDVAHASTYLAMLHGGEVAERFAAAYRERSGRRPDRDEERFWQVMDIVGYLPDPAKVTGPWRDVGRPVGDALARDRLERRLAAVLGR